ncbi:hypothetical protein RHMOL_Rhmol10G0150100 [Rhododendron molle]|uniref:Uncharacterized protein n=1 Tax=Rhododendron molle TaxID=49168 RepID=A0ACC0M3F0_RHOML|nr:hypothetical protein RHMOL_Rhmol10G0150100 [Rhododendron molle]
MSMRMCYKHEAEELKCFSKTGEDLLLQIMAEATQEGSAEGFIELIMNFTPGLDAGLYGLASISVVLNALNTASGKPTAAATTDDDDATTTMLLLRRGDDHEDDLLRLCESQIDSQKKKGRERREGEPVDLRFTKAEKIVFVVVASSEEHRRCRVVVAGGSSSFYNRNKRRKKKKTKRERGVPTSWSSSYERERGSELRRQQQIRSDIRSQMGHGEFVDLRFTMIKWGMGVIADGLTFGKLAFLAYCNGTKVEVFRGNQCTIDDFREHVFKCATSRDIYMVSLFDRAHFKQNRGSHITPIGAYHVGRDLVHLMDVSCFGYRFFWIPLTLLWEAMTSSDKATGNSTGFMVLSRLPHDPCVRYTLILSCGKTGFDYSSHEARHRLQGHPDRNISSTRYKRDSTEPPEDLSRPNVNSRTESSCKANRSETRRRTHNRALEYRNTSRMMQMDRRARFLKLHANFQKQIPTA